MGRGDETDGDGRWIRVCDLVRGPRDREAVPFFSQREGMYLPGQPNLPCSPSLRIKQGMWLLHIRWPAVAPLWFSNCRIDP
jgi:hypothetical protein